MKAAVSLLRHRFGLARMHAKAAALELIQSNPEECITPNNLDEYCRPKCRFMQYILSGETNKHVGMVSENGTKMIQLSRLTCAQPDMGTFINQRYCMESLLDSTRFMEVIDVADNMRLLPPLDAPGKIIGIVNNYYSSCREQHIATPREPQFYAKFSTAITGALDNIRVHQLAKRIDYGCQLAVVIGSTCRCVPRAKAMSCVFGYVIAQDISARDWNVLLGGQLLLGKSQDTFCPLGPVIVHKCHVPDVNNLWIKTKVNGEERQDGNTKDMIFKLDFIIHQLSQYMTLCPGDIILTGSPAGVGAYCSPSSFLKPGDLIESEIEKLGKMCNKVINPYA